MVVRLSDISTKMAKKLQKMQYVDTKYHYLIVQVRHPGFVVAVVAAAVAVVVAAAVVAAVVVVATAAVVVDVVAVAVSSI